MFGRKNIWYELASLHPGMRRSEISHLMNTADDCAWDGSWYNWNKRCRLEFDRDDLIKKISFFGDFPKLVRSTGLKIGMPQDDALRLYPTMQHTNFHRFDDGSSLDTYEYPQEYDGFEISVSFRSGTTRSFSVASHGLRRIEQTTKDQARAEAEKRYQRSLIAAQWKDISDPDDMLDHWVKYGGELDEYQPLFADYAAWLREGDYERLHIAAVSWVWNYGVAPLFWIIRQPHCDLATAVAAFYQTAASDLHRYGGDRIAVPKHKLDAFDLVTELTAKTNSGFYNSQKIAFDGTKQFELEFRNFPDAKGYASFRHCLMGKTVPSIPMVDGFPVEVLKRHPNNKIATFGI